MDENNLSSSEEKTGFFKKINSRYNNFLKNQIFGNFWIIGVCNILINSFCVFLILLKSILGEILISLLLLFIFIILFINILFILFPTKFPKKVSFIEEKQIRGQHVKEDLKLISSNRGNTTSLLKLEDDEKDYLSEEDIDLEIPIIPPAPKKKEKLTLDTSNLSNNVLERIKSIKTPNTKVVLVNCERCKAIIPIPIPKNFVSSSELPVVPVSFVHKNLQNKDQHCITIHLDHDFDIRRQRISDIVLSYD